MSLRAKWFKYCVAREKWRQFYRLVDRGEKIQNQRTRKHNIWLEVKTSRRAWYAEVEKSGFLKQAMRKGSTAYNSELYYPISSQAILDNHEEDGYQLSNGEWFLLSEPL